MTKALSALTLCALQIAANRLPVQAQSCSPSDCFTHNSYSFEVVAKTGTNTPAGALLDLGTGPSVNERGEVAFQGQIGTKSSPKGGGIFLWSPKSPSTLKWVTPGFLSPNRVFLDAVRLNDADQVAALDRFNGAPPAYLLRQWNANVPGAFSLIARSGFSTDPFGLVFSDPWINGSNQIVFSGADPHFNYLLATPNPALHPPFNELLVKVPVRPEIADNGMIAVRFGNTDTSPINLIPNDLDANSMVPIATSAEFSSIGQSPGISKDGVVVAFSGDLNTEGGIRWSMAPGPGIFIAIIQNGAVSRVLRVAGFSTDKGIGTKEVVSQGQTWCDPNPQVPPPICYSSGELEDLHTGTATTPVYFKTFTPVFFATSLERESRIAVTHTDSGLPGIDGDSIVVSFLATPTSSDADGLHRFTAGQGIWTVRTDVFQFGATWVTHVYRPQPVMQIGDSVGASGLTVTGLSIYDNLANVTFDDAGAAHTPANGDHREAFWASTSDGGQMIVRASFIQEFGGSGATSVGCCISGTLGALVNKGGVSYILSNDHVFGRPQSAAVNGGTAGDPISDPGQGDYACRVPHKVATFAQAPALEKGVDTALATLLPGEMNTTGQIANIGIPSKTMGTAKVHDLVAKQGRTTGLTCGKVAFIMDETVNYTVNCDKAKVFSKRFQKQIVIVSKAPLAPFSAAGDSGSLIVSQTKAEPVGLLFAGAQIAGGYQTVANPISQVAYALGGITFTGGPDHVVEACNGGEYAQEEEPEIPESEVERVDAVKEKYEEVLMRIPGVIGVGVGASEREASEAAIIVMVLESMSVEIPESLDGIRTRIVRSAPVEAFVPMSCGDRKQ